MEWLLVKLSWQVNSLTATLPQNPSLVVIPRSGCSTGTILFGGEFKEKLFWTVDVFAAERSSALPQLLSQKHKPISPLSLTWKQNSSASLSRTDADSLIRSGETWKSFTNSSCLNFAFPEAVFKISNNHEEVVYWRYETFCWCQRYSAAPPVSPHHHHYPLSPYAATSEGLLL